MPKPFSKHVFKVKLALSTFFRHENSVQSCFFTVCILRPIRPVELTKSNAEENFHGNE